MTVIESILRDIPLPKMVRIRQHFPRPVVEDIPSRIREALGRPGVLDRLRPGMSVAITAGSRGVANIHVVLRELVAVVTERGAHPFIIPAMGSHGGATAEGQLEILTGYGITEAAMGCPIRATMEVQKIGAFENGDPIYIDRYAAEADGIIVVGRVKPHTLFHDRVESGICKMMAIGLAKQIGAAECHKEGPYRLGENVQRYGYGVMERTNILCALALMENAFDETARIEALMPEEIRDGEPPLLDYARAHMAAIRFKECDVMICDEIGKNISGDGMDPNVAGRWVVENITTGPHTARMVILDIADESHGNANGIGFGDMTTQRAFDKFSRDKTYPNGLTSGILDLAVIPPVFGSDKLCIQAALATVFGLTDPANARIIRFHNTKQVNVIEISEALLPEALADPGIEVLSEPYAFQFDQNGNLF